MAFLRIKNITTNPNPYPLSVRGEGTGSVVVQLGKGEEFWTPNDKPSNSISILVRKNMISVESVSSKPEEAAFFETYPIGYFDNPPPIEVKPKKEEAETEKSEQTSEDQTPKESVVEQIKEKIENYTLNTGKWSKEDVDWLKDNYANKGAKECAEKLHRSEKAVRKKVESLGLKKR